jgi:hypothetical protein
VLGAAPRVGDVAAPVAIATVTSVGYLGSFSGPPLIGALAGLGGLSAALGLLVAVSGLLSLLARRGREPPDPPPQDGIRPFGLSTNFFATPESKSL